MSTPEQPLSILVVEDNPADQYLIEEMLGSLPLTVSSIKCASRLSEACSLLQTTEVNLIFLDLSLPDSFGINTFLELRPHVQHIPVIILSGLRESTMAAEALQLGAQDYLVKGQFKSDLLTRTIKYSIDRKNAEEKIVASEKNYRQMFYKNPYPAWIYDPATLQILEVNDAAVLAYGYDRSEFLGLTLEDLRPQEDIPALLHSVKNRNRQGKLENVTWRHRKKNGDVMHVEVAYYEIDYFGRVALQAQIHDITEKKILEAQVARQQVEKQQQITTAILETQEEERKTLGAELHDNINQILATAQLYLSAAFENPAEIFELTKRSQNCVVMAVQEIRKLSKNLITPFFTSGLAETIEDLTNEIQQLKKISIETNMADLDDERICDNLKLNIYRIVQEQLNNILKYAEATKVTISTTILDDLITLSISDNGKGFDTSRHRSGIGMINIRNRAEVFNGSLQVNSSPGKGCTLKVELLMPKMETQEVA
jgi:two-component system sensor histidine kinase UhpB